MKKIIVLAACLLLYHFAIAQKVQWGPESKKESKFAFVESIIGKDKDAIYAIMQVKESRPLGIYGITTGYTESQYALIKYDRNLKPIKEIELKVKLGKELLDFEFGLKIKDKIHLFFSDFNKKEDKNELYLQTFNPQTLETEGSPRKICAMSGLSTTKSGFYSMKFSEDSTKVLIIGNLQSKKDEKEKFLFTMLGENMKQIWQKNISLPYTEKLFGVSSIKADNDGNIFILGKNYKDKLRETRGGEVNYTYELFIYKDNGQNVIQKSISLGSEQYINDLSFEINEFGIIVAVGLYSNRNSDDIAGSFVISFDQLANISKKDVKPFSTEFISSFKGFQRKKAELKDFSLKDLVVRDDGSMLAVAEQVLIRETSGSTINTGAGGTIRTSGTSNMYFTDLILINITKDLSITWTQRIPKFQKFYLDGRNYRFASFASYQKDNIIYLMYGDNYKNANIKNDKDLVGYDTRNPTLMLITLTSDGKMSKKSLIYDEENELVMCPPLFEDIGDNELFIYGQGKKKKYKIGKITF